MSGPKFAGMSGNLLMRAVTSCATMGFLLFGYDQGVMSGIIDAKPFNDVFTATKDNSTMQGTVTAIYEIGCLFGAVFILGAGDWLGRRLSIIMGASIMILGVIIQVTSYPGHVPLAQFIIGRVVTGIGNGINTSTIPTYQAECSRTSNRGLLICIEGATIAFGTLIAYWIDFGASYGPPGLTWRFPIAFQIFFGLLIIFGMLFLPESPRWLFTRERYEEGEAVIAALMGKQIADHDVQLQKAIILDSIKASGQAGKTTPLSAVFSGGKTQHFRRMLLGSSSQFFQQIGGCNAVIYYLPVLFKNSIHQSDLMSMILGGVNMIVYSIFATLSWFLIERVGRRKLFWWGTIGQCASMVITFACLIPGTTSAAKGAAFGLFTYIASFGATWLPLPWLYPAEISPIKTRAKANAISTCTNWLFNFLIVMVTPIMITNISWGTYLFFACINACFLPVIYFFYPETAGRSLEEIDFIFAKGYLENMSYVRAAKELPHLSDEDVERVAMQYGFGTAGDGPKEGGSGNSAEFNVAKSDEYRSIDHEKV
ncbi:hexose carrier protein [Aspergillus sclerotiicarbonarius CBS 121057]|uniref:Hexose carrier protein n=1 Tax=Aspergillus sclerotiicarbonarius (strain CBS 121057 / IBT 28362) TaxID=1448318 RepID=A0A319FDH7_ASPSB|nr:hexose carrier protein [Aspergillus sclerotiicarbonarius CBS 121057]